MTNQVRVLASMKDEISGPLSRIIDKFDRFQKQGAKGFAIGAGAFAAAKAFSVFQSAVSGATDFLMDSVKAAIADEASVKRLAASLQANVAGFDGHTEAIERNIKAMQRFGFDDEELRDSLTVLVGATHDVGKAQQVMGTAMDLARFKGIDLRTASEALIKVEGGHYRSLAQLGIKLKEGATATEALAAVQAVAEGQMEAYAETVEGKAVAAQIQFNEAQEDFGRKAMPVAAEALRVLALALDSSTISYQDATDAAAKGSQAAEAHARAMTGTLDVSRDLADREAWLADQVQMASGAMDDGAKSADDLADELNAVKKKAKEAEDAISDLTDTIIDELYGDAVAAGERADLVDQLVDYGKELRQAKKRVEELAEIKHPTKAQQRDLQDAQREVTILTGKIGGLKGDLLKLDYQIAESKGPEELKKWFDRTYKSVGKTDDETRALIDDLRRLAVAAGKLPGVVISVRGGQFQAGKALGGPVRAGEPYVVGEKGPELFMPGVSGNIVPNDQLQSPTRRSSGGGGPAPTSVVVNVYASGVMTPAMARGFGDTAGPAIYDYLYRRGALGRVA